MRRTICWTEYSCGHWADCPCSSPNAVFLLPSLFWHTDKNQQGKAQEGESKVSPWQKFTPNFTTLGNRRKEKLNTLTMCFKPVTSVFCWCQIQYSCWVKTNKQLTWLLGNLCLYSGVIAAGLKVFMFQFIMYQLQVLEINVDILVVMLRFPILQPSAYKHCL